MRRREFLASASAGLVAAGLRCPRAWAAGPESLHRMKISLFSAMFRPLPLRTAMEGAAAIGYDGVEICAGFGTDHLDDRSTPQRAREIRTIAADHNLVLPLIYTPLGGNILLGEKQRAADLEAAVRFVALGKEMSCTMVKVTAGRLKNSAYQADEARTVADWLAAACDRAARWGSRIVTEIHSGQYCETVDMALRMIALVGRPNFGLIHDAGNLHILGENDGPGAVRRLGDRIFHVHVKDMVRVDPKDSSAHDHQAGRFKRALLNKGSVDHRRLFRALWEADYRGFLSCEASGGDDPVAVAKHEYAEMQKLLTW